MKKRKILSGLGVAIAMLLPSIAWAQGDANFVLDASDGIFGFIVRLGGKLFDNATVAGIIATGLSIALVMFGSGENKIRKAVFMAAAGGAGIIIVAIAKGSL